MIRARLLGVAIAGWAAVAVLAAVVITHPYLPPDALIERDVQATDLGPLTSTFPFFSWLGGPGGLPMQAMVVVLVLLLNRPAWMLALASLAGGLWYLAIVNLVGRPRPTVAQILRVTEHPGSTSFPSGHLVFITISAAVLMLCIGNRRLPGWAKPIGWAVVVAIVLAVGLDRISVGAHWPSDVLAGVLIAISWLALVLSVRRISDVELSPAAVQPAFAKTPARLT